MNDPQKDRYTAKNAQYMGTKILRRHRSYNSPGHDFKNTHVSNSGNGPLPSIPDELTSELKLMASVENYHNGDQDEALTHVFCLY